MILEAEKPHDLQPANWRPRRASATTCSESKGLRTRGADGVNPSLRAGKGEMRHPSSHSEAGKKRDEPLPPTLFVPFRPSTYS